MGKKIPRSNKYEVICPGCKLLFMTGCPFCNKITSLELALTDKDMELYKLKDTDDQLHRDNVLLEEALKDAERDFPLCPNGLCVHDIWDHDYENNEKCLLCKCPKSLNKSVKGETK